MKSKVRKKNKRNQMQSTWKIVKNKGLARGIEHYTIRG